MSPEENRVHKKTADKQKQEKKKKKGLSRWERSVALKAHTVLMFLWSCELQAFDSQQHSAVFEGLYLKAQQD